MNFLNLQIRDDLRQESYVSLENFQEGKRKKNKLDRIQQETIYSSGESATLEISEQLSKVEAIHLKIRAVGPYVL